MDTRTTEVGGIDVRLDDRGRIVVIIHWKHEGQDWEDARQASQSMFVRIEPQDPAAVVAEAMAAAQNVYTQPQWDAWRQTRTRPQAVRWKFWRSSEGPVYSFSKIYQLKTDGGHR